MMRRDLHFHHDPVGIDDQTSDRLLAGTMAPDDAPPRYREVARLLQVIGRQSVERADPVDVARIAAAFAESPRPRPRRSTMSRRLASKAGISAALVSGLTLFGGLAAAGALPDAAQSVASDMLAKVGVTVPNPDDHAGDHPNTRGASADQPAEGANGAVISETAQTTDATGVDKGAEISTQASDGKSQAGQDHGAPTSTPPSLPTQAATPDQANDGLNHRP